MNSPTFSKIANESKDLKISFLNHTSLINKYSYVIYSRNKLIEKPSNHRQNYVYKYLYIIHSKKNSPWMTSSTKISNIRWKKFLPLHRQILIVNIRTSLDSTHWSNQEASNIRKVVPLYFQITHHRFPLSWPVYFDITTSLNIFKPGKPGEQHLPRISKPFVYLVCRVSITWKPGLRLFFLSRRWTCEAWKATGNEPPGPSRLSLHSLPRNGSRSWLKM